MNKIKFAQEVCEIINQHGYITTITENNCNNGSYVAITVKNTEDAKVAPVFNIGDETESPAVFAQHILNFVPASINTESLQEVMTDKEELLKRTYYILVNRQLNEARTSLVRRPVNQTLELQYKIDVTDILDGGRISLEKKHLEKLGITETELYSRAYSNTMEKFPYKLQSMGDILGCNLIEEIPQMYVLTNSIGVNGAGAILYKGIKELLDEMVGEDAIVIPSSVHEMIIIPTWLGDMNTITGMIRDVNTSCVSPEDVLSDRPYELVEDGVLFEM